MKFYFLNTCYACPEQYDVYRENGEICGYIRLRWGTITAEYPNIDGKCIYEHCFNDDFKGNFEDEAERSEYLGEIAVKYQQAVLGDIHSNLHDSDASYEILTDPSELEEMLRYA